MISARYVSVGVLGVVSAFQGGMAAGMPWGAAAWGGHHSGVLPGPLRAASGCACVAWAVAAAAVALAPSWRRRPRWLLHVGLTSVATVSAVVNALSPSAFERYGWAPVCLVLALAAWRSRQP